MTAPSAKQVNEAEKGLQSLAKLAQDNEPRPSARKSTPTRTARKSSAFPVPGQSPREQEAEERGKAAVMAVPHGMKQSGVPVSDLSPALATAEQLEWAAQQQLTADVLSGKDPHTPNPTTASDKPVLAGTGNVITAGDVEGRVLTAEPTAEDLQAIAAQIEPSGNIEATDEQKEGAAVQIVRETAGPVVAEDEPKKKAKK